MSFLGIDVGTSRTKAVAYSDDFRPLVESSLAYPRLCPQRGWYELDAAALQDAVRHVVRACAAQCKQDPVHHLACSVFGGGITALSRDMQPLTNVISTTDQRAQAESDEWCHRFGAERSYQITGTTTHPSLMLPKVLWLARHLPQAADVALYVTAAELVQAALGVRPRMDLATASTTMLLDIEARSWSDEILAAAVIPIERLPALVEPGMPIESLPDSMCAELGLARGCVLVGGGHDQQVCALGAGLLEPGAATDSLGTVECITTLFERPLLRPDLLQHNFSNLLHVVGDRIATLAYNFSAGDLFAWLRDNLSIGCDGFEAMFAQMSPKPANVLALPHFAGSGTPHLDALSKGMLVGLTLQTSGAEMVRAVVDGQNYEMRQNLDIWRRHGISFDRLRVYGRGATMDSLLQIKADILQVAVERLNVVETGCLGAALLAAVGASQSFPIREVLARQVRIERTFEPNCAFADVYARAYTRYQELYPRMRELLRLL
jgi:xylulokinase